MRNYLTEEIVRHEVSVVQADCAPNILAQI